MVRICIEEVSKDYGALQVLKPFSLNIEEGEFVVLVGPSGCGKSTILKILAGLEPASSGRILLGERDVTDLAPGDRDIAMVFQNYALYPHLSVRQNIGFGLKMRGMKKNDINQRVEEAAKTLGVDYLLDRKPKALSGGQRQRVALGRAIVREPQAFLMDEPLSNLDAKLRVHMRAEISALHKRIGVTTVYVTHDQIEALTMADRVVLMRDGSIQQIADPNTLFQKPNNIFAASFIGSPGMNFIHAALCMDESALQLEIFGTRVPIRDKKFKKNQRLIAGLRPEHFNLGQKENIQFNVYPTLIESLGSEIYIYFRDCTEKRPPIVSSGEYSDNDNATLIARVPYMGALPEGEALTLSFNPENLYLFDADTGQVL